MGPLAQAGLLRFPRLLALAAGMVLLGGWSVGLPCAVVVRADPPSEFLSVANRLHDAVFEVQRPVPGFPSLLMPSGAALVVASDLAVTSMQAVGNPTEGGARQSVVLAGASLPAQPAEVIGTFPAYGLAILRLERSPAIEIPTEFRAPAPGENLIMIGSGDGAVDVMGVSVTGVQGDLFGIFARHMVDSRFWGGPLLDAQGRLVGICLPSPPAPIALSGVTLRLLLTQFSARR